MSRENKMLKSLKMKIVCKFFDLPEAALTDRDATEGLVGAALLSVLICCMFACAAQFGLRLGELLVG